jgi:cytoskeleton protein RodZ
MRGDEKTPMSNVSQLQEAVERKERRRLHLREVADDADQTLETQPKETLSECLREARIARGEEISLIAAKLKLRSEQLAAIEAGDYEKLPGRTYAVGFVRTYARYLGLDADAMVQRFKDESAATDGAKPAELIFPEAVDEPRMLPNGSILIWAMLIAMLIYGISYLTMPSRKSATTAKADIPAVIIEEPSAAPAKPEVSVTEAWRPVSTEPPVTYVNGTQVLPAADAPEAGGLLAADAAPALAFAVAQVEEAATDSSAPAPAQPAAPAVGASRITLKALEPTYIQIKDTQQRGGRAVLVARVLNAGESLQAPDRAGLVMQTGNAGGLQVEVDGRTLGVLGKSGEVITRIPVDPSYFLERLATTQ